MDPVGPSATGRLADAHADDAQVLDVELRHFGGVRSFGGTIQTVEVDDDNALVRSALSNPGAGRVLVVDARDTRRCAISGPTHVELALANGWSGLVVNGPVRYVRWLSQQRFGVLARGSHPRRPAKRGTGVIGATVTFGGVAFRPGAYLRADEDGVVVVPGPVVDL